MSFFAVSVPPQSMACDGSMARELSVCVRAAANSIVGIVVVVNNRNNNKNVNDIKSNHKLFAGCVFFPLARSHQFSSCSLRFHRSICCERNHTPPPIRIRFSMERGGRSQRQPRRHTRTPTELCSLDGIPIAQRFQFGFRLVRHPFAAHAIVLPKRSFAHGT